MNTTPNNLSRNNGNNEILTERDKRKNDFEKFVLEKKKLNKEFLFNAKKNQVEKCLDLMVCERGRIGADINCKDEEGWTVTHHAAWNGNLKFLNILLYNDAKIDVKDTSGVTPLILAVAKGHATITHVLINAGADVKVRDSRNNNC